MQMDFFSKTMLFHLMFPIKRSFFSQEKESQDAGRRVGDFGSSTQPEAAEGSGADGLGAENPFPTKKSRLSKTRCHSQLSLWFPKKKILVT